MIRPTHFTDCLGIGANCSGCVGGRNYFFMMHLPFLKFSHLAITKPPACPKAGRLFIYGPVSPLIQEYQIWYRLSKKSH